MLYILVVACWPKQIDRLDPPPGSLVRELSNFSTTRAGIHFITTKGRNRGATIPRVLYMLVRKHLPSQIDGLGSGPGLRARHPFLSIGLWNQQDRSYELPYSVIEIMAPAVHLCVPQNVCRVPSVREVSPACATMATNAPAGWLPRRPLLPLFIFLSAARRPSFCV